MKATIVVLPGDGIGPEVTAAALTVLSAVAERFGHSFAFEPELVGGAACDAVGEPLPPATLAACRRADAALLGAVGGAKWSSRPPAERPEAGLLGLRKHFDLYANLRPIPVFAALANLAPVKSELLAGVDILFVRELAGGLYFGARREEDATGSATDTLTYSTAEVERVARVALLAARARKGRLTSVDKANVLATSRLWQRAVERVAQEFPEVTVEHALVDSFAMRLIQQPAAFDVVVTENLFGDILSDEASVLAGSLGLLPSASLGEGRFGLYEPVHGSAPDIAGKGIANPLGAILSAALLLRHSLGLEEEANAVEGAVAKALTAGNRTADLVPRGQPFLGTEVMTEAVVVGL